MERMNKKERDFLLLEMIQYALQTHKSEISKDEDKLDTLSSLIDWTLQASKEDLKTIYSFVKKAENKISDYFHEKDLKQMAERNKLLKEI